MSQRKRAASGQTIEELRRRFETLNETRIKIQAQRDSAMAQLEQVRKSAIEQFGTDDVGELRARLAGLLEENERLRAEYEQGLDQIESNLAGIEAEADADRDEN
jgi:hypothetical protein